MISPPTASQASNARSVLPLAVGPTMQTSSLERTSSMTRSPMDTTLQLVPRQTHHDGPTMRTVTGEVDLIERREQRARFFGRDRIAGADRSVTGHRGEDEIDRAAKLARARTRDLTREITNDACRIGLSQKRRQRMH